jgi:hypothetical protein
LDGATSRGRAGPWARRACVAGLALSVASGAGAIRVANASPSESVVFYYQNITPADAPAFQGAAAVVTAGQTSDAQALATIHAAGARAFRYLDFYWYPADATFEGINIGEHPGWAFCEHGRTPLVGRRVGGVDWYFLDANERPARAALVTYLKHLKSIGYDGIFVDRGSASLRGPARSIAWHASTCTGDPIMTAHRQFANVYVRVLRAANAGVGLDIILNYAHPFTGARLRPDPADPSCHGGGPAARCRFLSDVWRWVGSVVDEHRVPDVGVRAFRAEYRLGMQAESHPAPSGGPLVIREVKTRSRDKSRVYYRWARARLFRMRMFVNTGNDGCGGSARAPCFHFGTYPLLTRVRLGAPLGVRPVGLRCRGRLPTSCVWIRRYAHGMTIVNPSRRPREVWDVRLRLGGCRRVEDVYRSTLRTPHLLAGGACLRRVAYRLPALGGRVLVYVGAGAGAPDDRARPAGSG